MRRRTSSSMPCARRRPQMAAETRLCQTIAGATGWPVVRSQRIVVSRWLVMPMAATCSAAVPLASSTRLAHESCDRQMASGSCSTMAMSSAGAAGCVCVSCVRVIWGNSSCAVASGIPRRSKRIALLDVVPWSSARMQVLAVAAAVIVPPCACSSHPGPARCPWGAGAGHTVLPVSPRIRRRPRPRDPSRGHQHRRAPPPRLRSPRG